MERGGLGDAGATSRSSTTTHVASLFFAGATPYATVLIGGERELQAFLAYATVGAHCACTHEHARGFARVADGEEHVGIDFFAIGVYSPGVVGGTKGEALSENGHASVRLSAEWAERKGQIRYPDATGGLTARFTKVFTNMRTTTQVMAHRGASKAAPANTIEAFALARRMGAHAVELDVRQCATGELVVHHDPMLKDGRILAHVVKEHLPDIVPTLDEALDACGDMWVNVEIKNHRTEPDYDGTDVRALAVLEVLRRRVRQHGDTKRYLVSCFRRKTVDRVHAVWPELPTAWLTMNVGNADELARDLASNGHSAVHPEVARVTREMIETFHAHGVQVNTWTCDDPMRIRELITWGIDGICTNVPDVALEQLRDRSA